MTRMRRLVPQLRASRRAMDMEVTPPTPRALPAAHPLAGRGGPRLLVPALGIRRKGEPALLGAAAGGVVGAKVARWRARPRVGVG